MATVSTRSQTRKRTFDQMTNSTYNNDFQYVDDLEYDKKVRLEVPYSYSHPPGWNSHNHYGMCGQSCPCCRFNVEFLTLQQPIECCFGVCPVCYANHNLQVAREMIDPLQKHNLQSHVLQYMKQFEV